MMTNYISLNGKIVASDQAALFPDNRSFRYADGLFETIKVFNNKMLLYDFHMDRLFGSLKILGYTIPGLFTPSNIQKEIIALCTKNNCNALARVRLSVWRGNGGLYDEDDSLQYMIEAWSLSVSFNRLNENGLIVGVYDEVHKSCDKLANIKSANFLLYRMAALHAKKNKWNDALVLNQYGRIADSTIANVFIVKNADLFTPSLKEGCISGTMRRYIIQQSATTGHIVKESVIGIADLMEADEVFLTNAIKGLSWVKQIGDKTYTKEIAEKIYGHSIQPFFS